MPRREKIAPQSNGITAAEFKRKWLDLAHKKLDAAVAAAYGWPADLSDEGILEKLLALNLERAAEEAKAAKVKKPKAQRSKVEGEMI